MNKYDNMTIYDLVEEASVIIDLSSFLKGILRERDELIELKKLPESEKQYCDKCSRGHFDMNGDAFVIYRGCGGKGRWEL